MPKIIHGHFKVELWNGELNRQKKQNVIGGIVSCGVRPSRAGQHLDQDHARPFSDHE
jgi:hypothetical protein